MVRLVVEPLFCKRFLLILVGARVSRAWVSHNARHGRRIREAGCVSSSSLSSSLSLLRLGSSLCSSSSSSSSFSSLHQHDDDDDDLLPPGEADLIQQQVVDDFETLPVGVPDSFRVVKQYTTPLEFTWTGGHDGLAVDLDASDVQRLALEPHNVTLPVALMLLDPDEYPSFSRARKACRKGNILIHRGPLLPLRQPGDNHPDDNNATLFDATRCHKGRVGDRVFPGDVIGKQVRMGSGYFPVLGYQKPPFELPVVYEDDHMALVNKPAGVVVYSQKQGGHGVMTVRAALPFVLTPPQRGTYSVMRRPASVHRLDKPTSEHTNLSCGEYIVQVESLTLFFSTSLLKVGFCALPKPNQPCYTCHDNFMIESLKRLTLQSSMVFQWKNPKLPYRRNKPLIWAWTLTQTMIRVGGI